jgi:hypothetical protein
MAGSVLLVLSIGSSSAQQQPKVTGFFTDMHYIEGAGDVLGTEVWIVYGGGQGQDYYAAVQIAEGWPTPPVVVPVKVSGSSIRFTIRHTLRHNDGRPAPDDVMNYVGTVSKAGLRLSISGLKDSTTLLKRQNSYWQ